MIMGVLFAQIGRNSGQGPVENNRLWWRWGQKSGLLFSVGTVWPEWEGFQRYKHTPETQKAVSWSFKALKQKEANKSPFSRLKHWDFNGDYFYYKYEYVYILCLMLIMLYTGIGRLLDFHTTYISLLYKRFCMTWKSEVSRIITLFFSINSQSWHVRLTKW